MTLDDVTGIVNTAIQITIVTSLPSIMVGLAIGLLIAVFQAVTQVQEQTLTFVPKMVVVLLVIGATFSWMSHLVIEMALQLWGNIPFYAR